MCGIFSYLGKSPKAAMLTTEGLKQLEYRGYDSFGFAARTSAGFQVTKKVGKISSYKLPKKASTQSFQAIGHTRWATHGGVTRTNAHPHASACGRFMLVHNGIIENYALLKKQLSQKGITFSSDTDTEVIVQLISVFSRRHSFLESCARAAKKCVGRYAFVVLDNTTGDMVAVRHGSPLILGVMNPKKKMASFLGDAFFVASDFPAFYAHTKKVVYIDDGQLCHITANTHQSFFYTVDLEPLTKRIVPIHLKEEKASRGRHPHFMLKEILEQKQTVLKASQQDDHTLTTVASHIAKAYGTFFVGCGTAHKVCLTAEYFFSAIAGIHINVIAGSEFSLSQPFLKPRSLLIGVSQSGETADVLEAFDIAAACRARRVAIVNQLSSTLARTAHAVLPVHAGPEKAVASTKATTAQLAICLLLAFASAGKLSQGRALLRETASAINDMLNPRYSAHVRAIAQKTAKAKNIYVIGRGAQYPIALESAIKLMEVTYIHCQGFAAGELKHGPLALIEKDSVLIAFAPTGPLRAEVLSNIIEAKARGASVIGVSAVKDDSFNHWIRVPDVGYAQPIADVIPIQLLAYFIALARRINPDQPRNLAKSVTVK